jgi:hypothetical protein
VVVNILKNVKKELKKEKEMPKKRTLNELRQNKDFGYKPPIQESETVKDYYRKVKFDSQYIVDLIKKFPNDQDLGAEIKKYFSFLKNND